MTAHSNPATSSCKTLRRVLILYKIRLVYKWRRNIVHNNVQMEAFTIGIATYVNAAVRTVYPWPTHGRSWQSCRGLLKNSALLWLPTASRIEDTLVQRHHARPMATSWCINAERRALTCGPRSGLRVVPCPKALSRKWWR